MYYMQAADTDKDGVLDREEFASFLHPQDTPHMKDIVVQEALDDMDKDKDGYVTVEEYIRKMVMTTSGNLIFTQESSTKVS